MCIYFFDTSCVYKHFSTNATIVDQWWRVGVLGGAKWHVICQVE